MGYCRANFGKKFLKINIDIESCYFNLGPSILFKNHKRDGIKRPSRLWLQLHPPSLLRLFNVDSYPLVKLLSLLPEPLVAVLSVYGEPESSGAVFVGFELKDNIVCSKSMIILYRMQFSRVSVKLHRK